MREQNEEEKNRIRRFMLWPLQYAHTIVVVIQFKFYIQAFVHLGYIDIGYMGKRNTIRILNVSFLGDYQSRCLLINEFT